MDCRKTLSNKYSLKNTLNIFCTTFSYNDFYPPFFFAQQFSFSFFLYTFPHLLYIIKVSIPYVVHLEHLVNNYSLKNIPNIENTIFCDDFHPCCATIFFSFSYFIFHSSYHILSLCEYRGLYNLIKKKNPSILLFNRITYTHTHIQKKYIKLFLFYPHT